MVNISLTIYKTNNHLSPQTIEQKTRQRAGAYTCLGTLRRDIYTIILSFTSKWTLENTEGAITNGQSRETCNIGYTRRRQTKTQHNMCWTPLYANKHK
jgi:hypothetical protein